MKKTAATQKQIWKTRLVKLWKRLTKWLGRLIDTTGKR